MKKYFLTHPSGENWPSDTLLLLSVDPGAIEHLQKLRQVVRDHHCKHLAQHGVFGVEVDLVRTDYDEGAPRPKAWDDTMLEYNDGTTTLLLRSAWELMEFLVEQAHNSNDTSVEIPYAVADILVNGEEYGFGVVEHPHEGWDWQEMATVIDSDGCFHVKGYFSKAYEDEEYRTAELDIAELAKDFEDHLVQPLTPAQEWSANEANDVIARVHAKFCDNKDGMNLAVDACKDIIAKLTGYQQLLELEERRAQGN